MSDVMSNSGVLIIADVNLTKRNVEILYKIDYLSSTINQLLLLEGNGDRGSNQKIMCI